jgi:hypothetical protein
LARDAARRPALFSIGPRAFGFTGHPGVRRAMIEDLIMEDGETPADPAPGLDAMTSLGPALEDALVPIMGGLMRAFGF